MIATLDTAQPVGAQRWAGRLLGGLVVALLLMDSAIKLIPIQPVIETMQALGFQVTPALARGTGLLLLACTLLYAVPRTAPIGAVLLTGYLGGAIAIHLRAGSPLFTHVLSGAYLGVMLWVGLLLRDRAARQVLWSALRG